MRLTIDFKERVIFLHDCTIADTKRLNDIIKASGCNPEEFTIQSYMELDDADTNDIDIVYEINKDEIN